MTVEWNEAGARAAAMLKAEDHYTALRAAEKSRQEAGGYTPWCSDGSIPAKALAELSTRWLWVRAGVKGRPADEALAAELRSRGYQDAPPGLIFTGDPPNVGIYLACPAELHVEHMQDQQRKHALRMKELMGRPRAAARQLGMEIVSSQEETYRGTTEQISAQPLPSGRRR